VIRFGAGAQMRIQKLVGYPSIGAWMTTDPAGIMKIKELFGYARIGAISSRNPVALKGRPTKQRRMNPALACGPAPVMGCRFVVRACMPGESVVYPQIYFLKTINRVRSIPLTNQ
jgi:hypothetical protein